MKKKTPQKEKKKADTTGMSKQGKDSMKLFSVNLHP